MSWRGVRDGGEEVGREASSLPRIKGHIELLKTSLDTWLLCRGSALVIYVSHLFRQPRGRSLEYLLEN